MSQQRLALVTGGSRGIGASIVDRLLDDGMEVIATATSEAGAQAITERHEHLRGMVLDLSSPDSIEALVKTLRAQTPPVTVLVNNAGLTRDGLLLRMSTDDWNTVLQVNLAGAFALIKGLLRGMMKQRWGRIINLSSVIAMSGNAGQANYAAAKAGMIGFTKSLAAELGSRNITANVVAPGFIETDMTAELSEDVRQRLSDTLALGRLGTPADIAAAVAFLASEDAAYITGTTLHVNGGMRMD